MHFKRELIIIFKLSRQPQGSCAFPLGSYRRTLKGPGCAHRSTTLRLGNLYRFDLTLYIILKTRRVVRTWANSHLSDSHLSESQLSDSHLSEFAVERILTWANSQLSEFAFERKIEVTNSVSLLLSLRNFPNSREYSLK